MRLNDFAILKVLHIGNAGLAIKYTLWKCTCSFIIYIVICDFILNRGVICGMSTYTKQATNLLSRETTNVT